MPIDPVSLGISASLSGINSLGKLLLGFKQNKLANEIKANFKPYEGSAAVGQNLATVQNAYSGRGAGFSAAQDKILQGQSNVLQNASRNATDASQLLGLAQGSQSQVDNSLVNLAAQEQQQKQGLLDNLQAAYGQKIQDDRLINQSQLDKYNIDMNAKSALRSAGVGNIAGAGNDAASLMLMLSQLQGGGGAASGIGNILGKGIFKAHF